MTEGSKTISAKLSTKDADGFSALARSMGTTVNGLLTRVVRLFLEQTAGLQAELREHRRRGVELAAAVDEAIQSAAVNARSTVPSAKKKLADEIVHVWNTGDQEEAARILTTLEGRARRHVEWVLERDHEEVWDKIRRTRSTRVNPPKEGVR